MKQLIVCLLALAGTVYGQPVTTDAPKLWSPYRITPRTGAQHIDLSGSGWELSHADKPVTDPRAPRKDPFQTSVPNSVHWSLYKAGKLPHPYYARNSTQYRWAEEKAWYYKKTFDVPTSAHDNYVFLCFDGVDYFSKVWVNDSLVGVHEGMFGGPSIEISRLLKVGGKNEVTVEVRAGNWGNRATDYESLPRTASGEFDYSKRTGYNPRASGKIIKPWVISGGSGGEAFFTVGMWQGVRLEIVPLYHLERPYLTTKSVANNTAQLHLSTEVFANTHSLTMRLHPWNNTQLNHPNEKGTSFKPVTDKLSVQVELMDGKNTALTKEFPVTAYEGRIWLEEDLNLPNAKLWQPNGLGEPNLYKVNLTLKKNGSSIDRLSFDYGIRTIERIATAGPRIADRWENWQFIVNAGTPAGRKIFVKGMNFTPQDILLDLPAERYRWTLEAAKKMGVQLIRIWGGGLLETDHFYTICNELGLMVWQDFPIGNQDTPDYPQDIWEAQVVQNIFRLRNHPSLVIWNGGNEFNPYSYGNAASVGIIERNLDIFDKQRFFVRTTPDDGSMHAYPDMDPTWYNRSYKFEPWVSETGMHSIPEPGLFYETVDKKEFTGLGKMWDKSFGPSHPEFIHHFTEYGPGRVPRMLSRASHITDVTDPTIEAISEASQIGAGEFYQVLSEKMQGNYPVTAGLMPWVFKRHWPVIAIQMMDWFGQAAAPYYFLKRTYEPTHVAIDLPRLLWKSGESIDLTAKVTHANSALTGHKVTVTVFDDVFKQLWKADKPLAISAGPSVNTARIGAFTIPADYTDRFLFVVAELTDASGKLVSRSLYFPRSLTMLDDKAFYDKYVSEPIAWPTLEKGPFLKPTVQQSTTRLESSLVSMKQLDDSRSQLTVRVRNAGTLPAFMTKIDIAGAKRALVADDNYFWLAPGESRTLSADVLWRETPTGNVSVVASAWNAPEVNVPLDTKSVTVQKLGK